MNRKPDLAERIGRTFNELDIDFSRFTFVGWIASLVALSGGGGLAYWLANGMVRRNGLNLAAGMTFCFTMLVVTTLLFLMLRWIFHRMGLPITRASIDRRG